MTEHAPVGRRAPNRRTVLRDATRAAALGIGANLVAGGTAAADDRGEAPARPELVLRKFVDPLPTPPVIRPRERHGPILRVPMRAVRRRLHSQLPPTRLWTYGGHFPGPTIEVRRGERLWVAWSNRIEGSLPVTAVELPDGDDTPGPPRGDLPSNRPGREGAEPLDEVGQAPAWLAVHVHGALTGGGNDGWMENAIRPGATQLAEYPNEQPATALWYHDHAMHMTRFTILSGLSGLYLVRDREEDGLGLPAGRAEIPLILSDRNFEVDGEGRPDGRLLHKLVLGRVDPRIAVPFQGPYSLVNGTIWPRLTVSARCYRFRLLNACNSRVYRLVLLGPDDATVPGVMHVIGTDGGLLGEPAPVDGALRLSPGERADVLVDFGELGGQRLRLVDTRPGTPPGEPDPANGIPEPDVMQVRVRHRGRPRRGGPPRTLAASFTRIASEPEPPARRRLVLLTSPGAPAGPQMWEMEEVDAASVRIPSDGIVQITEKDGRTRTYRRMAARFDDATHYVAEQGAGEEWRFLALGGPPHPMHIHLLRFQVIARDYYDVSGWDPEVRGTTGPLAYREPAALEEHETGWKDVIRVASGLANPGRGELVTVSGRFGPASGRAVYHCHVLEHQNGMMRPFTVLPKGVRELGPDLGGSAAGGGER